MDRLLKLEPSNRVVIPIEPGQRCAGSLTLRNVMHTMPVAFRLVAQSRGRFGIRPQTGIIAPLAMVAVEIAYLPGSPPDSAPNSDESFALDSVVAPGASVKDGTAFSCLDSVPGDWFTAKKKQVFSDSALRVFFAGSSVLARLVADGDMESVREVLEASDPEWRAADSAGPDGRTLLHLAISGRRADMTQLVLEFGADPDPRGRAGPSPLESAAALGEDLIVELLLARGASALSWPALHHAAAGGHLEVIRVLLAAGARADARGGDDAGTALHAAAAAGGEAAARMLVEMGCAGLKEARNAAGKTAYDLAAEEGHDEMLGFLKLGEGLAAAARKGEGRVTARALEMGAVVDERDGWGWTALMRAGFKGRVEVMRALMERGAALDARDGEGYTALHCAVEAGQAEAVEILVKRGADPEARTTRGRTALEIAQSLGYAGIARILSQEEVPETVETPVPRAVEEKPGKGMKKSKVRVKGRPGFVGRPAPVQVPVATY